MRQDFTWRVTLCNQAAMSCYSGEGATRWQALNAALGNATGEFLSYRVPANHRGWWLAGFNQCWDAFQAYPGTLTSHTGDVGYGLTVQLRKVPRKQPAMPTWDQVVEYNKLRRRLHEMDTSPAQQRAYDAVGDAGGLPARFRKQVEESNS